MKKGYYLYPGSKTEFSGVEKKVDAQIKVLSQYFEIKKIIIEKESTNFLKSILWRLPFGSWGAKYDETISEMLSSCHKDEVSFIYIRAGAIDRRYLEFLRNLKTTFGNAKIVLEVATFPYRKELLQDYGMWPWFFKDMLYSGRIKRFVDKVVTFTEDELIFDIPTIRTHNGIIVDDVPMGISQDVIKNGLNRINLIAVAQFQKSHGYERIIKGLADYYSKPREKDVYLYMVGEGDQKAYYERLTQRYGLQKYVIFHGKKSGNELNALYDDSDIGLSCFGLYKRGIDISSALKVREYLAHGLPIVSGVREDVFDEEGNSYFLRFPNDKSNVSIERIVNFYCELVSNKKKERLREDIRSFAKQKLDMEIVLKPVIEYLK